MFSNTNEICISYRKACLNARFLNCINDTICVAPKCTMLLSYPEMARYCFHSFLFYVLKSILTDATQEAYLELFSYLSCKNILIHSKYVHAKCCPLSISGGRFIFCIFVEIYYSKIIYVIIRGSFSWICCNIFWCKLQ